MSTYGFVGTFKIKEGKRDELISVLLEAAKGVSTAKGCRQYLISKDTKDENTVIVTEIWNTKEDHDNALKAEGAMELISKAMPLMDGKPESKVLEIIGGKGPEH